MHEEGGQFKLSNGKPHLAIPHCDGLGKTKPIKKRFTTTPVKIVAHLEAWLFEEHTFIISYCF